jgi:predicted ATP-grasp superfamily ATP-dependent carboligase
MKISNLQLPILGMGELAFDRLGLENFFPNYKVLSLKKSNLGKYFEDLSTRIISLPDGQPDLSLSKVNIETAFKEINWDYLQRKFNFTHLLTYKPARNQKEFEDRTRIKVLGNSREVFDQIENKANLRKLIKDKNVFPEYRLLSLKDLQDESFENIFTEFRKFVLQDSELSAGRGTFIISSKEEYRVALNNFERINSQEIVLSKFVEGRSSSVQVCVTKYGVFSLPLQQQIIGQPELNIKLPQADTFNGGQWGFDDFSTEDNAQAKQYAQLVGGVLQSMGYKGIFGIDFIVSDSGVYIIEVNARITGMTRMITMIQEHLEQIPFILLHVLELAKIEYELTPDEVAAIQNYSLTPNQESYGYLLLFNNVDQPLTVGNELKTGFYNYDGKEISFDSLHYKLNDLLTENKLMLIDFPEKGANIQPNEKIGRIIVKDKVLDLNGNLSPAAKKMISLVKNLI